MVDNTAKTMQRIMLAAAEGDRAAYGPAIRLLQTMHDVMQPGKDERLGPSGPIMPRFTRPSSAPPAAPQPTESEPTVIVDGQAHVSARGGVHRAPAAHGEDRADRVARVS